MFSLVLENRLLFMLLSLSAALHGGALLLHDGKSSSHIMTSANTPISLTLVQPAPATIQSSASPARPVKSTTDNPAAKLAITRPRTTTRTDIKTVIEKPPQQAEKQISQPVPLAQFSSNQSRQVDPRPQPKSASLPPDSPAQQVAPVHSVLQAALQSRLRFNRHYPRTAIRRGMQGRVELAVQIGTKGQIAMVRVLQSSGHYLLDQAAKNSIEGLASLPEAVALLDLQPIELTIPVIYKLE